MMIDKNPNAATQAKKRWNAKHYDVVKASVSPDLAAAFKAACKESGVSVAGKLAQFMTEYSSATNKSKLNPDYSTRRKRRAAVHSFVKQLERVRDAEEQCRDNTPENLRESSVYEIADEYVTMLEEAIDTLNSIY